MDIPYHITALQMTIYYNREGDHDHNGLMFALDNNVAVLRYLEARAKEEPPSDLGALKKVADPRAAELNITLPTATPADPKELREAIEQARVHALMRPLVLRCNEGDTVTVHLKNEIKERWIGLHLVGDGYDVKTDDGSQVGENPHSLVKPGQSKSYTWVCPKEGVYPFHDGGNYSGGEDGTNVHGLFGALIVEPENTIWRDPVTGKKSREKKSGTEEFINIPLDGLYLDVIPQSLESTQVETSATTLQDHDWGEPKEYANFKDVAHREFVIFFHDEPEYLPPHGEQAADPCLESGDHGSHGDFLPIMPVSYRAEPMVNRERKIWNLLKRNANHFGDRPVLNEEQHHSSWMFGDPATPILKAYIGDPVRIRFVHAAVKETHVFHLHMYEWHVTPTEFINGNPNNPKNDSPRIDAISVSPQTAHTIEPVWGAGNRHQVAGDVIWHCHLYPHFHEGMWGIFRTFETLQTGKEGEKLAYDAGNGEEERIYGDRRIGLYPDGTPIDQLLPLPTSDPERKPPPLPTPTHPGFPLYIPGLIKQKSTIPPWPDRELMENEEPFCGFSSLKAYSMPEDFNYRAVPYSLERNAFNKAPLPGELFTRNPFRPQQHLQWIGDGRFKLNGPREVCHKVVMEKQRIDYNGYGWHDKDGHLYYLENDDDPEPLPDPKEPLFFRAQQGQILNLKFQNLSPLHIEKTAFDPAFPPCEKRNWQAECTMHVHMVKFDPICADGASTGWNYISGPVANKKMIYRWWLDKEFGTIFFHDHLFANYRQKHGLFGALIVEPIGAKFWHPKKRIPIISGLQARIETPRTIADKGEPIGIPNSTWAREFCIGIGDFIPMWDRKGRPLNPPHEPGGHGDQGVMALNYRCDPIAERMQYKDPTDPDKLVDPSLWFSSLEPYERDPYTTLFLTYNDDPLWFRIFQGSHEEQHSFQIHGMRWRQFRVNTASLLRNQQTIGISEAFTFANHEAYKVGDYMYKLSSADDLWLGCWGLIRALPRNLSLRDAEGLLHLSETCESTDDSPEVELSAIDETDEDQESYDDTQIPAGKKFRHFRITVERQRIVYREPDLVDPYGLVYTINSITGPDGEECPVHAASVTEPLVLRCREGEWVRVTLFNEIPEDIILRPEPFAPEVPVERKNPFSHRPDRPVSSLVSMHADLVCYDVRTSDGANVGRNLGRKNRGQAVKPVKGNSYFYEWDTSYPSTEDTSHPSKERKNQEPLGPILLQDMADFRNHRHHGLIGALIIEYNDATPYYVAEGEASASADAPEAWHGTRVTVKRSGVTEPTKKQYEEAVLLMQDGLRLYLRGNIHLPISDEPPAHGEDDVDHEDQGQKGFNYRSEPVGPNVDPAYNPNGENSPGGWLSNPNPATPVFFVPAHANVRLHLLGALDKPRNQSFTVHGVTWLEWQFIAKNIQPRVSSESAITTGTVRTFEFKPIHEGDYAYRSGVLKWAVPQGLWGIIRVKSAGKQDVSSIKPSEGLEQGDKQ